ncbi:MAG: ABC transporter substrate-binding protein [Desulfohalobiaceae bacterium]
MRISFGIALVLLATVLLLPGKGMAASPREAVNSYIGDVLQTFQSYNGTDLQENAEKRKAFKEELSSLARDVFAYRIMVRMSLGRYWADFSEEQQDRMVDLFVRVIEDNYFGTLVESMDQVESYSKDMIRITGETVFSSKKAEVRSVIRYQDKEIPVNYRMLSRSEQGWQVYDIHVEDVSLISNYRSQFQDLLNRKSPQEVIDTMQRKVEKDETPDLLETE